MIEKEKRLSHEENIGSEEMFDNFFLGGKNNLLDDSQQRQIYELKVGKR